MVGFDTGADDEIVGGGILYEAAPSDHANDVGVVVHGSGDLRIDGTHLIHDTSLDAEVLAPGGDWVWASARGS